MPSRKKHNEMAGYIDSVAGTDLEPNVDKVYKRMDSSVGKPRKHWDHREDVVHNEIGTYQEAHRTADRTASTIKEYMKRLKELTE